MNIKVNPLFFAFTLILIVSGHIVDFAFIAIALVVHELSHAFMARLRGYVVKNTVIMPYGAMMSVSESFDKTSSVLIGLAGPFSNFLLALITLGAWWLFPAIYPYTISFLYANLSLGIFNLLPVYPLDGSRVVLGFCKNKLKAIKGLQIAGVTVSILFLALFITSIFFKINFSLGIMAVFLFYGAAFGTKEEMYISVLESASKNYAIGVEQKAVEIDINTPIVRLYHHVSSKSKTTFHIVDEKGNEICILDENELKQIAIKNKLSTPIGDILHRNI